MPVLYDCCMHMGLAHHVLCRMCLYIHWGCTLADDVAIGEVSPCDEWLPLWVGYIAPHCCVLKFVCLLLARVVWGILNAWIYGFPWWLQTGRAGCHLSREVLTQCLNGCLGQWFFSQYYQCSYYLSWWYIYQGQDWLQLRSLRADFCCCVMANLSSDMHMLLKNDINK